MRHFALVRWGAAALVALATSVVVASDLAELHRRSRSLGPERTVVVAERDLALGTTIHADDLTTRRVHETQLPDGVATSVDDITRRVVVVPVLAGSFVTPRHLAPPERDGVGAIVPAGSRAVSIEPASTPTLQPGDVVDVLATFDTGGGAQAQVVAPSALVVRVDDIAETEHGTRPGVTVLVHTSQAARVAEAVAVGVVTLALAAPEEAVESASRDESAD